MAKNKKKKRSGRGTGALAETNAFLKDGTPRRIGGNLPEGTYEGIINGAIVEPKETGGHRVTWPITVTSPEEFEDRVQRKRNDLSTQMGVDIFLGDVQTLELSQPKDLNELGEILEEADGVAVRFYVGAPKDEYPPSVYFNEKLEEGESGKADGDKGDDDSGVGYTKKELKGLGKEADNKDKEAIEELEELADENKLNSDEYDTWVDLADQIIVELEL